MNEITYVPPTVPSFRLDLRSDPDFTRKGWGRKLKALGGDFTECRGDAYTRFCTVPNTPEGVAWAASASATFGGESRRGIVIVLNPSPRSNEIQSANVVHEIQRDNALEGIERAVSNFIAWHRRWWDEKGRAAAEAQLERDRRHREYLRQQAPKWVSDKVREALKLGVEPEVIREAVNRALMDHATELSVGSQEVRS